MPDTNADPRGPRGPARRPPRRPPDPRTLSRLLYVAVAVIALLLIFVAVRAALS
jgi:hypothetical protein